MDRIVLLYFLIVAEVTVRQGPEGSQAGMLLDGRKWGRTEVIRAMQKALGVKGTVGCAQEFRIS